MYYFGPWDDPEGALEKYLDQEDDLHAGRTPPCVWTVRMLTALFKGVEGGKWFMAKGWDFHRWPNAIFAEQGMYSLVTAHASVCQSSRR